MNHLDEYQDWTDTTAVYPGALASELPAIAYTALGLAGEAGEIANKVKKLLRDEDTPERRRAIGDELGDVLWYVARLAAELDISLSKIAVRNMAKLDARAARGTLQGSGDDR